MEDRRQHQRAIDAAIAAVQSLGPDPPLADAERAAKSAVERVSAAGNARGGHDANDGASVLRQGRSDGMEYATKNFAVTVALACLRSAAEETPLLGLLRQGKTVAPRYAARLAVQRIHDDDVLGALIQDVSDLPHRARMAMVYQCVKSRREGVMDRVALWILSTAGDKALANVMHGCSSPVAMQHMDQLLSSCRSAIRWPLLAARHGDALLGVLEARLAECFTATQRCRVYARFRPLFVNSRGEHPHAAVRRLAAAGDRNRAMEVVSLLLRYPPYEDYQAWDRALANGHSPPPGERKPVPSVADVTRASWGDSSDLELCVVMQQLAPSAFRADPWGFASLVAAAAVPNPLDDGPRHGLAPELDFFDDAVKGMAAVVKRGGRHEHTAAFLAFVLNLWHRGVTPAMHMGVQRPRLSNNPVARARDASVRAVAVLPPRDSLWLYRELLLMHVRRGPLNGPVADRLIARYGDTASEDAFDRAVLAQALQAMWAPQERYLRAVHAAIPSTWDAGELLGRLQSGEARWREHSRVLSAFDAVGTRANAAFTQWWVAEDDPALPVADATWGPDGNPWHVHVPKTGADGVEALPEYDVAERATAWVRWCLGLWEATLHRLAPPRAAVVLAPVESPAGGDLAGELRATYFAATLPTAVRSSLPHILASSCAEWGTRRRPRTAAPPGLHADLTERAFTVDEGAVDAAVQRAPDVAAAGPDSLLAYELMVRLLPPAGQAELAAAAAAALLDPVAMAMEACLPLAPQQMPTLWFDAFLLLAWPALRAMLRADVLVTRTHRGGATERIVMPRAGGSGPEAASDRVHAAVQQALAAGGDEAAFYAVVDLAPRPQDAEAAKAKAAQAQEATPAWASVPPSVVARARDAARHAPRSVHTAMPQLALPLHHALEAVEGRLEDADGLWRALLAAAGFTCRRETPTAGDPLRRAWNAATQGEPGRGRDWVPPPAGEGASARARRMAADWRGDGDRWWAGLSLREWHAVGDVWLDPMVADPRSINAEGLLQWMAAAVTPAMGSTRTAEALVAALDTMPPSTASLGRRATALLHSEQGAAHAARARRLADAALTGLTCARLLARSPLDVKSGVDTALALAKAPGVPAPVAAAALDAVTPDRIRQAVSAVQIALHSAAVTLGSRTDTVAVDRARNDWLREAWKAWTDVAGTLAPSFASAASHVAQLGRPELHAALNRLCAAAAQTEALPPAIAFELHAAASAVAADERGDSLPLRTLDAARGTTGKAPAALDVAWVQRAWTLAAASRTLRGVCCGLHAVVRALPRLSTRDAVALLTTVGASRQWADTAMPPPTAGDSSSSGTEAGPLWPDASLAVVDDAPPGVEASASMVQLLHALVARVKAGAAQWGSAAGSAASAVSSLVGHILSHAATTAAGVGSAACTSDGALRTPDEVLEVSGHAQAAARLRQAWAKQAASTAEGGDSSALDSLGEEAVRAVEPASGADGLGPDEARALWFVAGARLLWELEEVAAGTHAAATSSFAIRTPWPAYALVGHVKTQVQAGAGGVMEEEEEEDEGEDRLTTRDAHATPRPQSAVPAWFPRQRVLATGPSVRLARRWVDAVLAAYATLCGPILEASLQRAREGVAGDDGQAEHGAAGGADVHAAADAAVGKLVTRFHPTVVAAGLTHKRARILCNSLGVLAPLVPALAAYTDLVAAMVEAGASLTAVLEGTARSERGAGAHPSLARTQSGVAVDGTTQDAGVERVRAFLRHADVEGFKGRDHFNWLVSCLRTHAGVLHDAPAVEGAPLGHATLLPGREEWAGKPRPLRSGSVVSRLGSGALPLSGAARNKAPALEGMRELQGWTAPTFGGRALGTRMRAVRQQQLVPWAAAPALVRAAHALLATEGAAEVVPLWMAELGCAPAVPAAGVARDRVLTQAALHLVSLSPSALWIASVQQRLELSAPDAIATAMGVAAAAAGEGTAPSGRDAPPGEGRSKKLPTAAGRFITFTPNAMGRFGGKPRRAFDEVDPRMLPVLLPNVQFAHRLGSAAADALATTCLTVLCDRAEAEGDRERAASRFAALPQVRVRHICSLLVAGKLGDSLEADRDSAAAKAAETATAGAAEARGADSARGRIYPVEPALVQYARRQLGDEALPGSVLRVLAERLTTTLQPEDVGDALVALLSPGVSGARLGALVPNALNRMIQRAGTRAVVAGVSRLLWSARGDFLGVTVHRQLVQLISALAPALAGPVLAKQLSSPTLHPDVAVACTHALLSLLPSPAGEDAEELWQTLRAVALQRDRRTRRATVAALALTRVRGMSSVEELEHERRADEAASRRRRTERIAALSREDVEHQEEAQHRAHTEGKRQRQRTVELMPGTFGDQVVPAFSGASGEGATSVTVESLAFMDHMGGLRPGDGNVQGLAEQVLHVPLVPLPRELHARYIRDVLGVLALHNPALSGALRVAPDGFVAGPAEAFVNVLEDDPSAPLEAMASAQAGPGFAAAMKAVDVWAWARSLGPLGQELVRQEEEEEEKRRKEGGMEEEGAEQHKRRTSTETASYSMAQSSSLRTSVTQSEEEELAHHIHWHVPCLGACAALNLAWDAPETLADVWEAFGTRAIAFFPTVQGQSIWSVRTGIIELCRRHVLARAPGVPTVLRALVRALLRGASAVEGMRNVQGRGAVGKEPVPVADKHFLRPLADLVVALLNDEVIRRDAGGRLPDRHPVVASLLAVCAAHVREDPAMRAPLAHATCTPQAPPSVARLLGHCPGLNVGSASASAASALAHRLLFVTDRAAEAQRAMRDNCKLQPRLLKHLEGAAVAEGPLWAPGQGEAVSDVMPLVLEGQTPAAPVQYGQSRYAAAAEDDLSDLSESERALLWSLPQLSCTERLLAAARATAAVHALGAESERAASNLLHSAIVLAFEAVLRDVHAAPDAVDATVPDAGRGRRAWAEAERGLVEALPAEEAARAREAPIPWVAAFAAHVARRAAVATTPWSALALVVASPRDADAVGASTAAPGAGAQHGTAADEERARSVAVVQATRLALSVLAEAHPLVLDTLGCASNASAHALRVAHASCSAVPLSAMDEMVQKAAAVDVRRATSTAHLVLDEAPQHGSTVRTRAPEAILRRPAGPDLRRVAELRPIIAAAASVVTPGEVTGDDPSIIARLSRAGELRTELQRRGALARWLQPDAARSGDTEAAQAAVAATASAQDPLQPLPDTARLEALGLGLDAEQGPGTPQSERAGDTTEGTAAASQARALAARLLSTMSGGGDDVRDLYTAALPLHTLLALHGRMADAARGRKVQEVETKHVESLVTALLLARASHPSELPNAVEALEPSLLALAEGHWQDVAVWRSAFGVAEDGSTATAVAAAFARDVSAETTWLSAADVAIPHWVDQLNEAPDVTVTAPIGAYTHPPVDAAPAECARRAGLGVTAAPRWQAARTLGEYLARRPTTGRVMEEAERAAYSLCAWRVVTNMVDVMNSLPLTRRLARLLTPLGAKEDQKALAALQQRMQTAVLRLSKRVDLDPTAIVARLAGSGALLGRDSRQSMVQQLLLPAAQPLVRAMSSVSGAEVWTAYTAAARGGLEAAARQGNDAAQVAVHRLRPLLGWLMGVLGALPLGMLADDALKHLCVRVLARVEQEVVSGDAVGAGGGTRERDMLVGARPGLPLSTEAGILVAAAAEGASGGTAEDGPVGGRDPTSFEACAAVDVPADRARELGEWVWRMQMARSLLSSVESTSNSYLLRAIAAPEMTLLRVPLQLRALLTSLYPALKLKAAADQLSLPLQLPERLGTWAAPTHERVTTGKECLLHTPLVDAFAELFLPYLATSSGRSVPAAEVLRALWRGDLRSAMVSLVRVARVPWAKLLAPETAAAAEEEGEGESASPSTARIIQDACASPVPCGPDVGPAIEHTSRIVLRKLAADMACAKGSGMWTKLERLSQTLVTDSQARGQAGAQVRMAREQFVAAAAQLASQWTADAWDACIAPDADGVYLRLARDLLTTVAKVVEQPVALAKEEGERREESLRTAGNEEAATRAAADTARHVELATQRMLRTLRPLLLRAAPTMVGAMLHERSPADMKERALWLATRMGMDMVSMAAGWTRRETTEGVITADGAPKPTMPRAFALGDPQPFLDEIAAAVCRQEGALRDRASREQRAGPLPPGFRAENAALLRRRLVEIRAASTVWRFHSRECLPELLPVLAWREVLGPLLKGEPATRAGRSAGDGLLPLLQRAPHEVDFQAVAAVLGGPDVLDLDAWTAACDLRPDTWLEPGTAGVQVLPSPLLGSPEALRAEPVPLAEAVLRPGGFPAVTRSSMAFRQASAWTGLHVLKGSNSGLFRKDDRVQQLAEAAVLWQRIGEAEAVAEGGSGGEAVQGAPLLVQDPVAEVMRLAGEGPASAGQRPLFDRDAASLVTLLARSRVAAMLEKGTPQQLQREGAELGDAVLQLVRGWHNARVTSGNPAPVSRSAHLSTAPTTSNRGERSVRLLLASAQAVLRGELASSQRPVVGPAAGEGPAEETAEAAIWREVARELLRLVAGDTRIPNMSDELQDTVALHLLAFKDLGAAL